MNKINQPQKVYVQGFDVYGQCVRTSNEDEQDINKASIPNLWAEVMKEHSLPSTVFYGVYSDYASDVHGAYTLTAGVALQDKKKSTSTDVVSIKAGQYLVFNHSGDMPQAVIELWQYIWQYFDDNINIKRNYLSDFEQYTPEGIAIHIGIV